MAAPDYKQIAQKKREARDAKFNPEWLLPKDQLPSDDVKDVSNWIANAKVLSPKELEITNSSAETIVAKIKSKEWSAVQVCNAFCHRASVAHQLTNCLSEVFFDEAIKQAQRLDDYQEKTGEVVGPLHGLPIAMKDNFNIKGQATTIGIVSFCFKPEKFEEDSVLVQMLRDLGAVFHVKTNVPVAMMMPETTNHVYGTTTNAHNRLLSAGGSSGGGASLALLSNIIAVSTDIGGSIRIPASYHWVYGLRPTFGRFPTYGARTALPGMESVISVNGPICNDLKSLEFYCKTIVDKEPWLLDPKVSEIPWRLVELPKKLCFAILEDDKKVRPTPPIIRGVQITKKALLDAGHEVIEWDPAEHSRLSQIVSEFFVSDGGINIRTEVEETGEPFYPFMAAYATTPEIKVPELWKLQAERTTLAKKFLDRWNATALKTKSGRPIDAIIMPATPFAGNPHGKFRSHIGYTSVFNALDYSVGTFPVTKADKDVDVPEAGRTEFYLKSDEEVWKDYDPALSHGGVVGLQLVGRRYQEEKVIAMLKVVAGLLNN